MLQPLDHDQSAPPLFLWLQRSSFALVGVHDWALRLLPFAFGIVYLVRIPTTFEGLLPARPLVATALLAACSPLLIQYSTSVKQYGAEAALTLLAVGMALRCREASYRGGPATRLTAFGTVLPWLAAPAPFVLTGVVGCALGDLARGQADARRFLLRCVPLWGLSFGLVYGLVYRPTTGNGYLRRYWSSALLAPPGGEYPERLWALANENIWGLALGYPGPPGGHLSNLLFLAIGMTVLVLLALGARWLLMRHGWSMVALVAAPLLATIGASFLGIYPVSLRLTLFAAPLVQLLLVSGCHFLISRWPEPQVRRVWAIVGAALVIPLAAISLLQVTSGPSEDVRSLAGDLRHRRRQEPVYVFAGSIPPWLFYSTDWEAPDRRRLRVGARLAGAGGAAFENAPSRGEVEPGEGEALRYQGAEGPELYGLATGIEWTPSLGPRQREPDRGWVEAEAARIAAAGRGGIWVLMSRLGGGAGQVVGALERRGACATYVRELDNAVLLRYVLGADHGGLQCRSMR